MVMKNGINRFSQKAATYDMYRPKYPYEIIKYFKSLLNLNRASVIADVGSGTGIFTKQILPLGKIVYGVEPNNAMRCIAENSLSKNENFRSVEGSSENTTLLSNSIDCISVSQAFHWFDKKKCKVEFKRILKENGFVVLLWNARIHDDLRQGFLVDFDNILVEFGKNYLNKPKKININELELFFHMGKFTTYKCENPYYLDLEQLKGTLFSSSYIQELVEDNRKALLKSLNLLFNKYQINNKVLFMYESVLYHGTI
jgi:SAM-dependent methyltransferase